MSLSFNNLSVRPCEDGAFHLHVNNHPYAMIRGIKVSEEEAEINSAVFRIGNDIFAASDDFCRVGCNFSNDEILRYKMDDNLSSKIIERLISISALYEALIGVVSKELKDEGELVKIKLFNAIRLIPNVLPEGYSKIAKKSPINFGVAVDSSGGVIINLDKVISKSFKVIKLGITLSGKLVVIVKPYLKRGLNNNLPLEEVEKLKVSSNSYWFKELLIMKHFKKLFDEGSLSPQILPPRSFIRDKKYTSLVFDKMDCDLKDYLDQNPNLSTNDRLQICYEVARVVHYSHTTLQLIHHDLKPRNFLRDSAGRIYLIDWGFARIFSLDGKVDNTGLDGCLSRRECTRRFVPPEGHDYYIPGAPPALVTNNELWDSWCLGTIFLNVMLGREQQFQKLQQNMNFTASLESLKVLERTPMPPERTISHVARMLIKFNMKDRITARQAFPIVQSIYISTIRQASVPVLKPAVAQDVVMAEAEEKKRRKNTSKGSGKKRPNIGKKE